MRTRMRLKQMKRDLSELSSMFGGAEVVIVVEHNCYVKVLNRGGQTIGYSEKGYDIEDLMRVVRRLVLDMRTWRSNPEVIPFPLRGNVSLANIQRF